MSVDDVGGRPVYPQSAWLILTLLHGGFEFTAVQALLEIRGVHAELGRISGQLLRAADLEKERPKMAGPLHLCNLVYIYGHSGQTPKARSSLPALHHGSRPNPPDAWSIAPG